MESSHFPYEVGVETQDQERLLGMFAETKNEVALWALSQAAERDRRDIGTLNFKLIQSGINDRRVFPARIQYDEDERQFYLEYDESAMQALMAQLNVDNTNQRLLVAKLYMGAEMIGRILDIRRDQDDESWGNMQQSLTERLGNNEQIQTGLRDHSELLDEEADRVMDIIFDDLNNSSPERIRRINTLRFTMGVILAIESEKHNPNDSEDNQAEQAQLFWQALQSEAWERDLQSNQGHNIDAFPEYLIAGCSPMSKAEIGNINQVIS